MVLANKTRQPLQASTDLILFQIAERKTNLMLASRKQRERAHWAHDHAVFSRTRLHLCGTEREGERECHTIAAVWAIPPNLAFKIDEFFSQTSQQSIPRAPYLLPCTLTHGR